MTKEIMLQIGGDNQLEILRLLDLDIKPCKACYSCMKLGRRCPRNDDMEFFLHKISEVDGIILSSPVYNWGVNIGIRRLLDRAFLFRNWRDKFSDKPCVTFVTYGLPYEEGYALGVLNVLVRLLNLNLRDSASFLGAWPGDVLSYEKNLEISRRLAEALFNPSYRRRKRDFECPNCLSNILKFRNESEPKSLDLRPIGEIECAFCGTVAEIRKSENGFEISYHGKGLYDEEFPKKLSDWHETSIKSFLKEKKNFERLIGKYGNMDVKIVSRYED
jgi:hypothetical protein